MTDPQSLVERLAGEAGFSTKFNDTGERLAKFAELMAAECEEACIRIAAIHQQVEGAYAAGKKAGAFECAAAIRQRFGVGE